MRFTVDGAATPDDGAVLWRVYDEVFGDFPDHPTWREAVWDKHRARRGFRLARAYEAGELVGAQLRRLLDA